MKAEALDVIKSRRSVRKFLPKDVSDELIETLIDAARHAPFGGPPIPACQLWEFIVVRKPEIKGQLVLEYKDRQYIKTAPVILAACADKSKDPDYRDWDITVSLAIENILLAAHALGLGACFVETFTHHTLPKHIADREMLINVLNLPSHVELIALIPIGWPDPSETLEKKVLRPLKEMIHHERWQ
jgi:nitroreductase